MSKMENNTVNKAGSTGVELNLNDGTQRYQVTKKDLKKTADRYNFMGGCLRRGAAGCAHDLPAVLEKA